MTIGQRIAQKRKELGLSQEALGSKLGVSRQAISKWETAESVPETGNLAALAAALGVTVDELLSEDGPDKARGAAADNGVFTGARQEYSSTPDWIDSLPKHIQSLARRWGWLAGVYIALCGVPFVIIGVLARVISNNMMSSFNDFGLGLGGFGTSVEIGGAVPVLVRHNPVAIVGTVIAIAGVVLIIAGIALAVFLKRKFTK